MTATAGARILVVVGGGIAAYKTCSLIRLLCRDGHDVTVIPTSAALQFVGQATWAALSGHPVASSLWQDSHDVPHIQLAKAADLILLAPATADLMAKAAHGIADCLASAVLLSATSPVMMAAAMHTEMWQHPATQTNVATLRDRGILVLEPVAGALAGCDHGVGRMVEPAGIKLAAQAVVSRPQPSRDLEGRRIVLSTGGTREPLDPVRFLSNHSSGAQGFAIAAAALARGADVTVVAAHTDSEPPPGVQVRSAASALDMRELMLRLAPGADAVVMAAAVADYRPAQCHDTKQKKVYDRDDVAARWQLELIANPDIVAELVTQRTTSGKKPVIVAFAAETGHYEKVTQLATDKLRRKGCDIIVANEVSDGKVFGSPQTHIQIIRTGHAPTAWLSATKMQAAHRILDTLAQTLSERS